MDRLRELIDAYKAEEISKEDLKELVTILVQMILMVYEVRDVPDVPDETSEKEEEKQGDVLGQCGLEEFIEPAEESKALDELTDAQGEEEEEIQGDFFQRQFGLEEFSSKKLDLPVKVLCVLKWLQTVCEYAILSAKFFSWTMEVANMNFLMGNLRKGEG